MSGGGAEGCGPAALDYAARGWSVVPLRPGDKRPLIAWEALQEHAASAETVGKWYDRWPDANVGIVTGAISHLVVLDVDPKHGGAESLERLEREHGPLADTVESISGGGGRHLYFRHPGSEVSNRAGLRPGLDLRGDGGYIVAPPSVHPNGRRYAWRDGRSPAEREPAAMPFWLLDPHGVRAGRRLADWRSLVREGVPEGERNSTVASLTGHLLWHEVDPEIVLELMLGWNRLRCRPPLDDDEVAQVVRNIAHLHEKRD